MDHSTLQVKNLPNSKIEKIANKLLGDYSRRYTIRKNDPIPVDSIIEVYLGLLFEIDDLRKYFNTNDVLGATWINEKIVRIDESLDPLNYPHMEGCYNFTVAHEIGHWVLHSPLLRRKSNQRKLLINETPEAIVYSSSKKKDIIENQAELFASYLLMPEERVINTWRTLFNSGSQQITYGEDFETNYGNRTLYPVSDNAKIMAKIFKVSDHTMQCRLEKLGIIQPSGLLSRTFI